MSAPVMRRSGAQSLEIETFVQRIALKGTLNPASRDARAESDLNVRPGWGFADLP